MATKPCRKYIPDPVPVGVDPKLSAWLKREFERVQQGICCCDSLDPTEPCTAVDVSRACLWDTTGTEAFTMGTGDTDVDGFEGFSATEDLAVDPGVGEIVFPEVRAYAVEFDGTFLDDADVADRTFEFWLHAGSDVASPRFTYQTDAGATSTQISFRYHFYPAPFYVDIGFAFKLRMGATDDTYTSPTWLNRTLTVESIGPSGAACQDTGCQWEGYDDPNITWDSGDEAWLLIVQHESLMSFVKPTTNRSGLDWWLGVQPTTLTISFYLEEPPGERTTTLTVFSSQVNALATIDLDDYPTDQWNTVTLTLSWSTAFEWVDHIRIDGEVYLGEEYPLLLKVCENDPSWGWSGG